MEVTATKIVKIDKLNGDIMAKAFLAVNRQKAYRELMGKLGGKAIVIDKV